MCSSSKWTFKFSCNLRKSDSHQHGEVRGELGHLLLEVDIIIVIIIIIIIIIIVIVVALRPLPVGLEFGMLVFVEGGKPGNPEKTLGAGTRTNKKFEPQVTPGAHFSKVPVINGPGKLFYICSVNI